MAGVFSKSYTSSKSPAKQRKYVYNAPLHVRGKLMAASLSKELRKKYSVRSVRVKKGDKVKIMRGQFKGKEGKVERVDLKRYKLFIDAAEVIKKDGSKTTYPIHPSNVVITQVDTSDKKRFKADGAKDGKAKPKAETKKETKPKATQKTKETSKEE